MEEIGKILKKAYFEHQFPLNLNISKHIFKIEIVDFRYIEYLYATYQRFIQCTYKKYFRKIRGLDENFIRYLYYVTEARERAGKAIHYYKNVKSVFTHYARDFFKNSRLIAAPIAHGHTLRHYRIKHKAMRAIRTGTIRKVNFDFEYIFFLLKNFTNFCKYRL